MLTCHLIRKDDSITVNNNHLRNDVHSMVKILHQINK